MHNPLMVAAVAMYRALNNLPCRCVSEWRNEKRHVTKSCARCASMQQWREAMEADGSDDVQRDAAAAEGLVVFEAVERPPNPETL